MSRRARRTHTPAFKAKVALAAIKGEMTLAQLAEISTSTRTRSRSGRRSFKIIGGQCVRSRRQRKSQPAVDVKALHAKIGELTLENDFLEGALSKAGLLSAKR